jgi:hypothetical protein
VNGAFAYTALLGCIFSPKKFGSSILLLGALQNVAWFFGILKAGNYTIGETIGLKHAVEKLQKKKHEFEEHGQGRQRGREGEKEHERERGERERDPGRENLAERHGESGLGYGR